MIRWEGVPAGPPHLTHLPHPWVLLHDQPHQQTSSPLTSPWRLSLRRSAWDQARATDVNINKACCWGPPVRGCHRRAQRRDASALTSRLISLSVRPTKKKKKKKKVGISAQSGIAFGSLSLLHDYWTPSSVPRLSLSSFSATLPKGGNPWGFKMATHRIHFLDFSDTFGDKMSLQAISAFTWASDMYPSLFRWIVTKLVKVCLHVNLSADQRPQHID